MLISISLFLLVPGAHDLRRPLLYGSFLFIPFLFLQLHQFKPIVKRAALAGLAFLLVLLSLPSFLDNAFHIPSWTFYDTEYASGEWIQSIYETERGLNVFTTVPVFWTIRLYVPEATYHIERNILEYENWGVETGWQILHELPERYYHFSHDGNDSVYILSPKTAIYQGPIYGISPDDPRWEEITNRLSAGSNKIYNNGPIQIYSGGR
jgi:hypothetical protein